jgi:hypothetical protein
MPWPSTWKVFSENLTRMGCGDCAEACVAVFLDNVSGGLYDVGIRTAFGNTDAEMKDIRVALVELMRSWQNPLRACGGGTSDAERLMMCRKDHWNPIFAALSLAPPACKNFVQKPWDGQWTTDIINGRGAMFSCNYWPVDAWPATDKGYADIPTRHIISGQWRFTCCHSLCIAPNSYVGGTNPTVDLIDPLADGRYSSSTLLDHGSIIQVFNGNTSPQTVRMSVLRKAAGIWAGTGYVTGVTYTYSASLGSDPNQITFISAQNPTHVTTQAAHGLTTGDLVQITGSDSTPQLTGPYAVTVLDTTHFTVPVSVSSAGSTGTWAAGDAPPPPPPPAQTDPCRDAGPSGSGSLAP